MRVAGGRPLRLSAAAPTRSRTETLIVHGRLGAPFGTPGRSRVADSGRIDRGDSRAVARVAGAPPTVAIERMTHEWIPEVCGLYKRVWDHFPDLPSDLAKAWTPSPLEFSSWMEGVVYYVARSDGKLVGVVGCEVRDGSCRMVRLAVDPDARRRGIGSALVHQAIERARTSRCPSAWADVLARFTAAAALLKHLEFTESGVLHRHYLSEDVRLFEKLL